MNKFIFIMTLMIMVGCSSSNGNQSHFRELNEHDIEELEYAAIVEDKLHSQFVITVDHPAVPRLNEMAEQLRLSSRRPYWPSEVFIIADERYMNACTGGRNIYIGSGLLLLTTSDDERAYIIAHELAHIDESHPIRTMKKMENVTIYHKIGNYLTSIVFAFIPAGALHPAVSIAAQNSIGMVNQAATDIIYKGYKRSFEMEADKRAVSFMVGAGYAPQASLSFLNKLEQAGRAPSGGPFSDHPAYEHRIEDIKNVLATL